MKLIARGITRPIDTERDPEDHGECDLMVMSIAKGQKMLKGNMIYEIVEILGVLQIREAGPCSIHAQGAHWGWDFGDVLTDLGGAALLTRDQLAKFKGKPEKYQKLRDKGR